MFNESHRWVQKNLKNFISDLLHAEYKKKEKGNLLRTCIAIGEKKKETRTDSESCEKSNCIFHFSPCKNNLVVFPTNVASVRILFLYSAQVNSQSHNVLNYSYVRIEGVWRKCCGKHTENANLSSNVVLEVH